ncbi:MAG TPA: MarR family transcriptional regulator [Clostridia bacterium]|nr:MarR family transcriptional regulator [Clostridia bacterium]
MHQEQAKELHLLFFSFMWLFHQKFWRKLRQDDEFTCKITKNQAKVIHTLYQLDSLTFTELSRLLDIEKAGLTTIISQLEDLGLVERCVDPEDRRKYRLSLSNQAKKDMDQVVARSTQTLLELFEDVEDAELEEFRRHLRQVVEFMKKL